MATPKRINASYDRGNSQIEVNLSLLYWIDNSIHFFYSPALDLTGYGNTEKEAWSSLEHTLSAFIAYTENNNTLFLELEKLGWTTDQKKKLAQPPSDQELLADNATYKELLNKPNVLKTETNFGFALT